MPSAEFNDLETTIHVVDQKVDRLALGLDQDLKDAHKTTQGAFDDLRAYSEFLAGRVEKHVTAEVKALGSNIERRFDRLEERLFRERT